MAIADDIKRKKANMIINYILDMYGVSVEEMQTKWANKKCGGKAVEVRQFCCKFVKEKTSLAYWEIGELVNCANHSSIIHSKSAIERRIETEPEIRELSEYINMGLDDILC